MLKYGAILSVSAIALQGCGGPCAGRGDEHSMQFQNTVLKCMQCAGEKMGLGKGASKSTIQHAAQRNQKRYIRGIIDCGGDEDELNPMEGAWGEKFMQAASGQTELSMAIEAKKKQESDQAAESNKHKPAFRRGAAS